MQHSDPDFPTEHIKVLLATGQVVDYTDATKYEVDDKTGALELIADDGKWVATFASGFWLQCEPSTTQATATPPPQRGRAAGPRLYVPQQ